MRPGRAVPEPVTVTVTQPVAQPVTHAGPAADPERPAARELAESVAVAEPVALADLQPLPRGVGPGPATDRRRDVRGAVGRTGGTRTLLA